MSSKIIKVTSKDIQKITPILTKYAQSTIDKQWRMLNTAFKLALAKRIITYNPMGSEEIKKPKSEKHSKIVSALTIEEQKN